MTRIQVANDRAREADNAMSRGDYVAAARNYTHAAEQLEAIWWAMHRSTKSPEAQNMRSLANIAIKQRDAA
jgi:hypothetical protein